MANKIKSTFLKSLIKALFSLFNFLSLSSTSINLLNLFVSFNWLSLKILNSLSLSKNVLGVVGGIENKGIIKSSVCVFISFNSFFFSSLSSIICFCVCCNCSDIFNPFCCKWAILFCNDLFSLNFKIFWENG